MDWIAIAQMIVIKLCTQRYTYFHFILYNFWKRLFIYLKILNAPFTESRHNSRPNLLQNPISVGVLENQDMLGGGWGQFAKIEFFIAKSSYIVKMFAKKNLAKKMKNYTFLKSPWPCHFKYAKYAKKNCNILNNLILIKKN